MKSYIHTYATISRVDSFENGILSGDAVEVHEETMHPNYKDYISPASIRRMSPVVKMGVTAGLKCLKDQGEIGGVVVGTALGCLKDTEKFLSTVVKHEGLAISPTAFIQSTHNTVAGQIALTIGNNGYNMTHSQQGISFECALLDGQLLSQETKLPVLVGACEENIDFLNEMAGELGAGNLDLAEGASYFLISSEKGSSNIAVMDVQTGLTEEETKAYLSKHQPDLVMVGAAFTEIIDTNSIPSIDYTQLSGLYGTNSAFGLQMAVEILEKKPDTIEGVSPESLKTIIVLNAQRGKGISVILVKEESNS